MSARTTITWGCCVKKVRRLVRLGRVTLGFVLVIVGVAMLFLPGPGLSTLVTGLILLAKEFRWARWVLKRLTGRLVRLVIYMKTVIDRAEPGRKRR